MGYPTHSKFISPTATVFLLLSFLGSFTQVSSLQFSLHKFKNGDISNFKILESPSLCEGGGLNLTSKSKSFFYDEPLCCKGKAAFPSFSSSFEFSIKLSKESSDDGGLIFCLFDDKDSNRVDLVEFTAKNTSDMKNRSSINYQLNSSLGNNSIDVSSSFRYDRKWKKMFINVTIGDRVIHDEKEIDLPHCHDRKFHVGFEVLAVDIIKSWEFTSENVKGKWNRVICILLPIAFLLFCVGFLCYRVSVRFRKGKKEQQPSLDVESFHVDPTMGPHEFRLKELKSATANFNPKNKLGQGGFGTVYRGFLHDSNKEVAVKRVSKNSYQGRRQFMAEVTTFSRIRHKNLVKLIGWCYEKNELLLVYDLLPKGSLDKLIFPNENSASDADEHTLSWEKRHRIICGVASALCYLHDGCEMKVLHRDLKASNVMIDDEYNAHLGDFGLARTVQRNGETHHSTNAIAGTLGYIAPECYLTGRANVETDVYGFGVLALEVACGRRPSHRNSDDNSRSYSCSGTGFCCCNNNYIYSNNSIVDWVWKLYGMNRIVDAADPRLLGDFNSEQMERVLKLGLACCNPNPHERPSMGVAVQVLTGEVAAPLPPQEKPAFVWPVITTFSGVVDSLDSDGNEPSDC